MPRNYRRRLLGIVICLSPVALLATSLVYGTMHGIGLTPGFGWVLGAALLAVLNFHLSFTRPLLYRWTHGSLGGYRFVSGVPGVGTCFLLLGVAMGFGDVVSASVGLGVLLVDTGGPLWFLVWTWKVSSFWNA